MIIDVVERNSIRQAGSIHLSQNQFLLLKILHATGPKTVSEIASIIGVSKPAASKFIDYLVLKGMVSRTAVAGDRRSLKISIISKGRNLVENYHSSNDKKIEYVMKHFSAKEKKSLNLLLDKYIFYFIEQENNLHLFCLQCGGQYDGKCPVGEHNKECYFQIHDTKNSIPRNSL